MIQSATADVAASGHPGAIAIASRPWITHARNRNHPVA
jgi:hypothetical protein